MSLWTAAEAAEATGGTTTSDWVASGVSIDTRTLEPGDLFIALKDVRDGHDFVAQALEKGAAAALVSRRPDGVAKDAPLLVVDDVLEALTRLGHAARARSSARIVAVTGSAGKTSTKEMLRATLSGQGRTHAAVASYNNHWGVPLTLARMPRDAEFGVVEIGMSAPGEIEPLARMARPHVAVVTTVAAAHLEAFDDLDGIAREKGAIFRGLVAGGTAILNGDLPQSAILREMAEAATALTFGLSEGCDIRATSVDRHPDLSVVEAELPSGPRLFRVGAPGSHMVTNALAVLGVAGAFGLDLDIAAADLGGWSPPEGRGTQEKVLVDPSEDRGFTLIDDAFNANPASMAASLDVLARTPAEGRRICVLGDMLELGPSERALHAGLAKLPSVEDIAVIHCAGPRMKALWEALPPAQRGLWSETADEMAARAGQLAEDGDVILVKGSKSSHVSRVVDALRNLGQGRIKQGTG